MYFIDITLRLTNEINLENIIGIAENAVDRHIQRPDIRQHVLVGNTPILITLRKIKISDDSIKTKDIKLKMKKLLKEQLIILEFTIVGYGSKKWDQYGNIISWGLAIVGHIGLIIGITSFVISFSPHPHP